MDLEPLNPEPFDRTSAPGAATPDAPTSESPRRRRRGYAVAATVAGLALVGVGFLLGRTSSGGHNVSLADASAIQDAAGGAAGGSLCGPATRRNIAAGNVASVASDGTSFTVTTPRRGSLKVSISKSTTFLEQTTGKVSDATPGMRIRVQGTRAADGTVAASHLAIAPASSTATPMADGPMMAGPMMAGPMGRGTGGIVKSNDNGTLTVTEPNGTDVKVTTTSATVVVKTIIASMSDVKPGLLVLAQGTPASDGSFTATHVDIVASGVKGGFGIFGGSPGRFFRPGPGGFRGGGGAGVSTAPAGPTA